MASVMKRRARVLARALREKAGRILEKTLIPGRDAALATGGAPVCAFGHALCMAAREEGVDLGTHAKTYNDSLLREFLNGEYRKEVDADTDAELRELAGQIARHNDLAFGHEQNIANEREVAPTSQAMVALAERLETLGKEEA